MSLGLWWREKITHFNEQSGSNSTHLAESQFLLLDIDITGLNVQQDYAKGIATLPLRGRAFCISDIRYVDLVVPKHSGSIGNANLLDQHDDLADIMAGQMVVTYNPRFVGQMIARTASISYLAQAGSRWIDLRSLLTGVFGTGMGDIPTMGRWQQRLNIDAVSEHSAVGDVVSMAQLLQVVLAYCEDMNIMTLEQLMESKMSSDWLRGE